VYPGSTRALIRRTIELQDVLGAHQDAFVLIEYLHDLAATRGAELGPEVVFAMGGLAERQRGVMAKLRSRVPAAADPVDGKAWRRLRRRITAAAAGNTPDDGGNGSGGRRRVQHGAPGDRAAGAGGDHGDVHEAGAAGTRA
jgi:hypothetical protein